MTDLKSVPVVFTVPVGKGPPGVGKSTGERIPSGDGVYHPACPESGGTSHRRSLRMARQMYDKTDDHGRHRYTVAQIATEFGVTRPTICRYLDQQVEPLTTKYRVGIPLRAVLTYWRRARQSGSRVVAGRGPAPPVRLRGLRLAVRRRLT